jgi:hypothetical protein
LTTFIKRYFCNKIFSQDHGFFTRVVDKMHSRWFGIIGIHENFHLIW